METQGTERQVFRKAGDRCRKVTWRGRAETVRLEISEKLGQPGGQDLV